MEDGGPEAILPGQDRQPLPEQAVAAGFWERCGADPRLLRPVDEDGRGVGVEAVAILLAGGLLARTALESIPGAEERERLAKGESPECRTHGW
jgi:hypothetical protein